MVTAKATYPFEVNSNGGTHVFTYKKAKLGLRTMFAMLWPSFIASCFLTYYTVKNSETHQTWDENFSLAITVFFPYWFGIAIGIVIILNLFRGSGTFTLTPQGIQLDGTTYPYSDIQGLYIKSPDGTVSQDVRIRAGAFVGFGGDRVQSIGAGATAALATATSATVGIATELSAASGRAITNSIKRNSFKICFRFGKNEKVLVRQVNEITAIQLLQKIGTLA